MKIDPRNLEL